MKHSPLKVNVVSMGCFKNLVDSEQLLRRLEKAGVDAVHDSAAADADVVVINTCGFIGDAKEESIGAILEACSLKQSGRVGAVYVMGCLSERYAREMPAEIPEVDGWYGKFDWDGIVDRIAATREKPAHAWERRLTTPPHHAYIKIAEGCNRFCAFCAIPLITGRYVSRPVDDILAEVTDLAGKGVREFNVIAQDLSYYGRDLYGRSALAELIDKMARIAGVDWIRLHYAYPADFPYEVLPVMARHKNVCKYLDIALQHIDDTVLQNMHRHIDAAETIALLQRIRREVPGIHIRTTLMVGFPGETDEAFARLLDFVRCQRFERMGAFAYCEEDDTRAAAEFTDEIPQEVKERRLDRLMALQEEISLELNTAKVGKIMRVMIDREDSDYFVARSEFDSPEVDPEILVVKSRELTPGRFAEVRITQAMPYELIAEIV